MIIDKENMVDEKKIYRKWEGGKTYKDTLKQNVDIEGVADLLQVLLLNSYFHNWKKMLCFHNPDVDFINFLKYFEAR